MLPRLTWPTCIKHASLGACTYVSTSRLKSYVLQGQQFLKRFHLVGFIKSQLISKCRFGKNLKKESKLLI